jgi:RNA polymerase sigma factor (sigma-70 family)
MKHKLYSDEVIVEGIGRKSPEQIRFVYLNYFDSIQRLILKNSGSVEDAEDIFQDALVIIYKKIKNDKLTLNCSLKTFIYAISRNLWLQKLQRKDSKMSELIEIADESIEPFESDDSFVEHQKFNLYQKYFIKLSKDCQKVLQLFLNKISLKEITRIMNFNSVEYTKTRKYLCKKTLKDNIMNDPAYSKIKE